MAVVTASLWNIKNEQQLSDTRVETILQTQLRVDMLRSQLWVFLQHDDKASLEEVYIAQQMLSENLNMQSEFSSYIKNLQRMNQSLDILLRKERSLYDSQSHNEELLLAPLSTKEAVSLLHSRYNMIVQNMAEELFHLQKDVLYSNKKNHEKSLLMTGVILLLFSVAISFMTLLVYKQFKTGSRLIKSGIHKLSDGDLSSRIEKTELDEEFSTIARFFNEMKGSLQENIVTKDQLEKEVKSKTSILIQQKDRLKYLSDHDSLTSVLNRRAFYIHLENVIEETSLTKLKAVFLFIDVDKFKDINDTRGHNVGDRVLVNYASRLRANIRPSDIIGRVGGDEFIICLSSLNSIEMIPSKLTKLLDVLDQPMEIEGLTLSVTSSIGVSVYPDHSTQISELLDRADQAMYQAKKEQRSAFCGFEFDCESKGRTG
ncbi:diguanylate cyclase [Vibrio kyushuensis]|uniref:diguanylate cyclase domain-containing protein n=1 Tax=Vibrio kyushuensis TaxID=2910249 RepID=UPI003D0C3DDE